VHINRDSAVKFLIAPDKFKGSMTARAVSECIAQTISKRYPSASIEQRPIADGGDGSLEILLDHGFKPVRVHTYNALMEPVEAIYGLQKKDNRSIAFLEMASICGIASLQGRELQPQFASSYGLGDVAYQVLTSGVDEIIVSVGGSASTDGGIGFLVGLGAMIKDASGSRVAPNLSGLKSVESIDLSLLHPRIHPLTSNVRWTFLVDVSNPLIGKDGAAYVFGPQKGLKDSELEDADLALTHWSTILSRTTGVDVAAIPGAGAAGGVASIAQSIFTSDFLPGSEWFSNYLDLREKISAADVVITGEGSFDSQSLMGKGPGYVLAQAKAGDKRMIILAGRIESQLKGLESCICKSLTDVAASSQKAISDPIKWLTRATEDALDLLDQT
jgi:glycerate 2-kinase